MNLLREVRRVNKRSLPVRITLLLTFCVIFIVTTYAWFSTQRNVTLGGLEGETTPWDVSYYLEDDWILDETVTFTVDEFYPGMPVRLDNVYIYNLGSTSTQINYELISVKVFGVEILNELKTKNEITTETTTDPDTERTLTKTNIFSTNTDYPFNVSYTYDRDYLIRAYIDNETTPASYATFNFNVDWPYQEGTTAEEIVTKDMLDTKFGKDAYTYYQNEANDTSKALEIKVKITSKMIHPDIENAVTVETSGNDGNGTAILKLAEKHVSAGYYMEIVVKSDGEELGTNENWEQADTESTIRGLSETDVIYVRITNGVDTADEAIVINLTNLFD